MVKSEKEKESCECGNPNCAECNADQLAREEIIDEAELNKRINQMEEDEFDKATEGEKD